MSMLLGIRWRTRLGPTLMSPTLTRGPNRRIYTRLSTTILLEFAGRTRFSNREPTDFGMRAPPGADPSAGTLSGGLVTRESTAVSVVRDRHPNGTDRASP